MKHRSRFRATIGFRRKGHHFLGEVERAVVRRKNRSSPPHTPGFAISQQTVQGRSVTSQDGRRDTSISVALQPLNQAFDKPMRGERGVPLKVNHDIVTATQRCMSFGAAFGSVCAIDRRHHHLGTKAKGGGFYTSIICRDNDPVHALHLASRAPTAFNQTARRPACAFQQGQGFGGVAR